MMEFVWAALPWVMLGIALVLYISKTGAKKAGDGKSNSSFLNMGLCMGLVSGVLVSFLGLVPLGMGLGMGALLGVLFGMAGGR